MGLGSLFSSSKAVIGLDIGTNNIKAVAIEKTGAGPKIVGFGISPLPEGIIVEGNISDSDTLSETIKDLIKGMKVKSSVVNVGFSPQNVIVRFIKIPQMSDDELEGNIKFEAEQYVPYAIEEVSIGYAKLAEVEEDGIINFNILLVCSQKEIVNSYLRMLKSCGMNPQVLEVSSIASMNSLYNHISDSEVIAVVDIGAASTNICIVKNGIMEFHRNISIAGNSITSVIQSVLKLDFAEAENIKKEEGTIVVEGEEENEVSEVIRTVIEDLASEIRRSFDYYKAQSREKVIHKIFLTGGTAYLRNIDVFLANELGIEVVFAEPLSGMTIGVDNEEELREHELELSAAIGLAIRDIVND